jgi:hypothetical protein
LFVLISAWNIRSFRNTPAFIEKMRAEAHNIDPLPQPTFPTSTVPVHNSVIPAPAIRVPVHTSPAVPAAAPIIPAIATPLTAEPSMSTSAVAKGVTSHPAGFKTGPPKLAARKATRAKPFVLIPAVPKPAVPKRAVAECAVAEKDDSEVKTHQMIIEDDVGDSSEDIWEPYDNIEVDNEQPDEDNEPDEDSEQHDKDYQLDEDFEQPAKGSGNYKRRQRRQPVKAAGFHEPPCSRCLRRKQRCNKEAGGGACYSCVVSKLKCEYSKSGHKHVSVREGRDVKAIKGMGKAKVRTRRKNKEFVEDAEVDDSRVKGSKSKSVDVSDDEDQKKGKQLAHRMKPAPAPAPDQLLSPERKFFHFIDCVFSC